MTASVVGKAAIAPFLETVSAAVAAENVKISTTLASSKFTNSSKFVAAFET